MLSTLNISFMYIFAMFDVTELPGGTTRYERTEFTDDT